MLELIVGPSSSAETQSSLLSWTQDSFCVLNEMWGIPVGHPATLQLYQADLLDFYILVEFKNSKLKNKQKPITLWAKFSKKR